MSSESINLFTVVQELQHICERADRERLGVWVEQFESEFPDLAEDVIYCAQMTDARLVLRYLANRDQRFALLKLVPNIEPTISFLQKFIRERSNPDESNSTAGATALPPRPRTKRRTT